METIYFLISIGVCAFVVVWVARRSKTETNFAGKRTPTETDPAHKLLKTPADNRLSHKEEIWERRRKHATKGFSAPKPFVPKSEAAKAAQYDGYSRRHRHHLTASEHVKEEAHLDERDGPKMTSIEFETKEQASRT